MRQSHDQFITEHELGGAGIVIDAKRQCGCFSHCMEVLEDFVLGQWRIGYRSKQKPISVSIFRITCQGLCFIGAQCAHANDDRCLPANAFNGRLNRALPLFACEKGISAGASEKSD